MLHGLGRGLRDAGYLVMPLNDADAALDLLCLISFDLVLADTTSLRYAGRHGGNGLAALVSILRGAPLLLFTRGAGEPEPAAEGALLVLGPPARCMPRLLVAIEQVLQRPAVAVPAERGPACASIWAMWTT